MTPTAAAQPELLDCTLRDGGYYTNWDFSDALVDAYVAAMARLPIKAVELGYRSPPKSGYYGRLFYIPRDLCESVRARLRPDQELAVMLNAKDVEGDTVANWVKDLVGVVDIIRFATPPTMASSFGDLARPLVDLGFKVNINVMYAHSYVKDVSVLAPLSNLGDILNQVSLVDSYGSCFPEDVASAVTKAREILPQQVGFHGHDNIGMAMGNALAAIGAGAEMVDATVVGMGRGAGNLKTELFLTYLNARAGKAVDYSALTSVVGEFERMQRDYGWGTNLAYMVSGMSNLPQADVMDWLATRRYNPATIVAALKNASPEAVDRTELPSVAGSPLAAKHAGKPVLILGGGGSVAEHKTALIRFAEATGALVIHSTLRNADVFKGGGADQAFCLAGEELGKVGVDAGAYLDQPGAVVIANAPPRFAGSVPADADAYQVAEWAGAPAVESLGPVPDEPPLKLALGAALELGAGEVFLAGFDGYANAGTAERANAADVQAALDGFKSMHPGVKLRSLTPTLYAVDQESVYARLMN